VLHAHAVVALTLSDEDHFLYMERVIHTMWNPRGYSREEEGNYLATLAEYKLERRLKSSGGKEENDEESNQEETKNPVVSSNQFL
jgi:hypothetical protein